MLTSNWEGTLFCCHCWHGKEASHGCDWINKSCFVSGVFQALVVDTLYATGVCMLAFVVLPSLDNVIQMAMVMMGVGLIPAIMLLVQRIINRDFYSRESEKNDDVQNTTKFILHISLDIVALLCQIIGLITWPIYVSQNEEDNKDLAWSVPLSLILISFGYWENYVDLVPYKGKKIRDLNPFLRVRKRIRTDFGVTLRLITSLWKMIFTFVMTMAFVSIRTGNLWLDTSNCENTISHNVISSLELAWVWVWLINVGSALVCYFGAQTAAKIHVQSISYALPLVLTTPLAIAFLGVACSFWNDDPCSYVPGLPSYVFFRCQPKEGYSWMNDLQIWLIIFWATSQFWLTWHIWWQKNDRLAPPDR